jgi:hypothetical protein
VTADTGRVNVLGHSHVALALGVDSPEHVLGAVLPDLASMARVRLDRSRLAGAVAEGVRCHLAADAAFHAAPQFLRGSGAIRQDLRARGLGAGPARAIGHIGWELLLDGTLLASPASDAYGRALAAGDGVIAALGDTDHAAWHRLLSHRHELPRLPYDDPHWVAERLAAMLAPRRLLRVDDAHVPAVAEVLADHVDRVGAAAPAVLSATVRGTADGLADGLAAGSPADGAAGPLA